MPRARARTSGTSLFFASTLFLLGCSPISRSASSNSQARFNGIVHGGQQPIANATVQLYAVGTAGDQTASTPLFPTPTTTNQNGAFTFPTYTCPSPSSLVYVAATGGNPGFSGSINNPGIASLAILGACGSLTSSTYISINELTTVAAAYALAPFMGSVSKVGSSPGDAAALANAFSLANVLANPFTGTIPGNVPSGVTVPIAQINTIADLIASCINSVGGTAGDGSTCGNLYSLSPNAQGIASQDTVTALLNLARHPTINTAALFNLLSPQSPFSPTDASVPADFSIQLGITTGLAASPQALTYVAATVGFAQANQQITITNLGATAVAVGDYGFLGAGAADYLVTDTSCSTMLAASANCTFTITYTPTATGDRSAYFYLNNGSVDPTLTLPISASAVAPAASVATRLGSGYLAFGDSNTAGTGYQPAYPTLLAAYFPATTPFRNLGVPGYVCPQQSNAMFNNLAPTDSGNPVVSDMIGTNDAGYIGEDAGVPTYFTQCQMGANAFAAMSSTNVILASSSSVQLTGQWANDTTYPNFAGATSTTANSCVTTTATIPRGVFYVWAEAEHSGGNFQVLSDGSVLTDTVTSTSQLTSVIPGYSVAGTTYVGLARFLVTPGTHTLSACVTSATDPANDVHIYGFGIPPAQPHASPTAPQVLLAGVMHAQDDPNDSDFPTIGIANTVNQQVASTLSGDGLNVIFVDVRAFVDPHYGMLSQPDGNCNASLQPGLHVNNCGTFSLTQAFWEAINGAAAPLP